ncbi:MAG TPA: iron uptake system protein EfeO [Xanthobacteraceae bacterium]|nr:iron uptake system protein EfeO [Xanthobacteraceae bacterium]
MAKYARVDPKFIALVAGASLVYLLPTAGLRAQAAPVNVTITDKGCDPNSLTVAAGKSTFAIKNASQRALEWEILSGVMVVEERENILPGFSQTLSATLSSGEYQMTCGLLNNPKGTLIVQSSAASAAPAPVSALDLAGPLAEYKLYVSREVDALVAGTTTFVAAIKANDLAKAQKLYAPTRVHYERIEPVAELFNDLDKAIDSRADDYEKKESDPGFIGFHKIEELLFVDKSTAAAHGTADKLLQDVQELHNRVETLVIPAGKMVGGAADLIEEVAATKITGEEDRYSHTDLWDFQANIDGARKIYTLLRPLAAARNPAFVKRVDDNFNQVDAILAKYKTADGFESYDAVKESDRRAMKGPITALAEDLSTLRGQLGLE